MARPKQKCNVDGCDEFRQGHGYCALHYARWKRTGDPLEGGRGFGEREAWLRESLSHDIDECYSWPFTRSKSGYGGLRVFGTAMGAHRALCFMAYGEPPSPDYQAAHECGKGHEGCMNHKHLRWATPKENAQETVLHDDPRAKHKGRKLSLDQVVDIKRQPMEAADELAEKHGVSAGHVYAIQRGKMWSSVKI